MNDILLQANIENKLKIIIWTFL